MKLTWIEVAILVSLCVVVWNSYRGVAELRQANEKAIQEAIECSSERDDSRWIKWENDEPALPAKNEDPEHLEPGQYLYYVSYYMNGVNPGACTVVMDNPPTNFSSVYGESNSIASFIRWRASLKGTKITSLIVNSFQIIDHNTASATDTEDITVEATE